MNYLAKRANQANSVQMEIPKTQNFNGNSLAIQHKPVLCPAAYILHFFKNYIYFKTIV